MKKQIGRTILAAAVLTALASFGAYAGSWTTDSAGNYYYKNDDGSTAVNSWIKTTSGTQTIWYYVSSNGALVTDGWKQINGNYYYFDGTGVMQTGWVDNDNYYCDPSSGAMRTGWRQLELPEDVSVDDDKNGSGTYWFYFNTKSGEKYHSNTGDVAERNIDGAVYGFDENGIMQTGWAQTDSNASPEIAGYSYFAEKNGNGFKVGQRLKNTWYSTTGPEGEDVSTGDVEWFYFKSNGHPAASAQSDVNMVQVVNGSRFLFNQKGNPVYGIQKAYTSSDSSVSYYYAGTSRSDCSVRNGRMTLTQDDGEKISCYFTSNGKGFTGVYNRYVYYNGRLQKAESDQKYQQITINSKTYAVDTAGRILKSRGSAKDADGNKFSTNSDGTIKSGSLSVLTPVDPEVTDLS